MATAGPGGGPHRAVGVAAGVVSPLRTHRLGNHRLGTGRAGRFREELEGVYADVAGGAVLASLEGWLTLRVICRSTGSLEVTGVACDQPGTGNRLEFAVEGMTKRTSRR